MWGEGRTPLLQGTVYQKLDVSSVRWRFGPALLGEELLAPVVLWDPSPPPSSSVVHVLDEALETMGGTSPSDSMASSIFTMLITPSFLL